MSERIERYAVFAGSCFYPVGGWDDFVAAFDSLQDAVTEKKLQEAGGLCWAHIVDLWTGQQDPQEIHNIV